MNGRGGRHWHRHRGYIAQMLQPALLLCLHHKPAHGYALMEQLAKFQVTDVPMGRVYRALRDMEASGWVTSTWDDEKTQGPPRRVYHLTAAGDKVLAGWIDHLEESQAAIASLLRTYQKHMAEGEGDFH